MVFEFLSEIQGADLNRRSIDEKSSSSSEVLQNQSQPDALPPNCVGHTECLNGQTESLIANNSNVDVVPRKKTQGSYELKFLVDDVQAMEIMTWARQHLEPDPHFDPEMGDGYHVNSLYLDTPLFEVFHREDGFRQQKYRLRRYGQESLVWCEQKRKRKGLVRKRRVPVDQADISARLQQPIDQEWDGAWFRRKVDQQLLRPVCRVTYQRFARMKSTDQGTVRLTIDDRLTANLADGWDVPTAPLDGRALLDGKRILELKFRGAIPSLFRQLIEDQRLQVTPFSKYRTSVETCVPRDVMIGVDRKNVTMPE